MSERIANIQKAVEEHAGCAATHRESAPVTEGYLDEIAWEGVVEVFDLDGHPKAKRCYGWHYEDENGKKLGKIVLEIPPVDSPQTAVRVSVAAKAREK